MSCVYCHSLWISFIYDVAERREVIRALIFAVHAIIDGNEADAHLGKADFRIKSDLQIVPAKPGHISLCQLNTKFFTDARGGQQVFPRPPPASALS